MSKQIRIRKGFDIKLVGKAEKKVNDTIHSDTYVVKPTDFQGFERVKLLVKEGSNVKAGTPIFYDKKMESVKVVAPVSGEVIEINRGEKRKLLEIKILPDKEVKYEKFKSHTLSEINSISKEDAVQQILDAGLWVNFIQRPYAVVANPEDSPKAIFISAFDSSPLAPDYSVLYKGQEDAFQAGLDIIKKLTSGQVHLNTSGKHEVAPMFARAKGVEVNKFTGPHPAGNVGVQIHHIDPVNKGETVWAISPYGVVQIGKLFLEGKHDASKVIALAGSEVKERQYYKTYNGASIEKFVENNVSTDKKLRYISGNVLTGYKIDEKGHIGYYHNMVTVIPEGDDYEFFGWILPTTNKLSFHRAFGLLSFLQPNKERVINANLKGEHRTFVQTGAFEKVLPMDIYPTYLLKAILAEDYEEMEALGILEVAEEDFALCEFIDVSKNDIQEIIRRGLDLMQNS